MTSETKFLLGIDTCGPNGGIALARLVSGGPSGDVLEILAGAELPGRTYSARLTPAIREMLADHEVRVAELAAIVVVRGPGSFTGIRIGLSTAKGLAEIQGIPLLAVSRLAVLAHAAQGRAAALDASRGEFYFGEFFGAHRRELLLTREDFLHEAARLGEDLAVCEAPVFALTPGSRSIPPPTAAQAIEFALPRLRGGHFDDPVTLDGNYLRRPDAEIFSGPAVQSAPAVRPMQAADLDAVAAIAQACPEAPRWTAANYAAFVPASAESGTIEEGGAGTVRAGFVAASGAEVLGFAAASLLLDGVENRCELESMAVRLDARRHGLGLALLRAVLEWAAGQGARSLALEVRAGNTAAIRLYERLGLRKQGRRPGYYADPAEDAVLLGAAVPSGMPPGSFSTVKGS